jgi:hypothetical protein
MILILSNNDDLSTDEVIDWLLYKEEQFFRINGGDYIQLDKLIINSKGNSSIFICRNKKIKCLS